MERPDDDIDRFFRNQEAQTKALVRIAGLLEVLVGILKTRK